MKKSLILSLCLGLAVCFTAQANTLIETRKANFKQNAKILRAVTNQVSDGDYQAIIQGAEAIAAWAEQIPAHFPEGSQNNGALPAIWTNFDDFTAKSKANQTAAMGLSEAAMAQDPDAVMNALRVVGGSCKSCHSLYKAD